jgi:4-amino-4-deoxy-L-arabinose transferase-like glycosyltransferase
MSQARFEAAIPESHPPAFLLLRVSPPTLLAGFVLLHIVVWTVLPIAFTHALPVDLVEGVVWGQGWQLGYDQPPFQAWFLGLADWLSGYQRWAVYLTSQVLVAISLVTLWRLALLIVTPLGALVAVLVLDGAIFFNFMTPNLYPDLIELPFWALAAWSFYRALRWGRLADWLLLGLWLAGAAYGKYVSALLALTMVGFMLAEPTARRCWRTPGPYLCGALCLALLAPHLWWAIDGGFATLQHIDRVSRPTTGLGDWLTSLAGFLGGEIAHVGMATVLILALRGWRPGDGSVVLAGRPSPFDRRFVATLALGPILLMLGMAVIRGIELRIHWGYALWCFLGLFAVIFVVPRADGAGLRRFGRAWASVFVAAGAAYAAINSIASLSYSRATPDLVRDALPKYMMRRFQEEADFPGREIAATITQRWHQTVGTPLAYLVGKKWIAGNVSFFSADHPLVLRDGDPKRSPWIDMAALAEHGAVLLWDPSRSSDDDPGGSLERAFPMVEMQPPLLVRWHSPAKLPPLRILWGIVRPADQRLPPSVPAT